MPGGPGAQLPERAGPRPGFSCLARRRLPQVLLLSYSCALLLRLSLAPVASISGVSSEVFRTLSTAATAITATVAGGMFFQTLLGPADKFKAQVVQAAGLARTVMVGNRALAMLDWLLSLVGAMGLQQKALYALAFALYILVLEVLGAAVASWQKRCR